MHQDAPSDATSPIQMHPVTMADVTESDVCHNEMLIEEILVLVPLLQGCLADPYLLELTEAIAMRSFNQLQDWSVTNPGT